MIRREPSAELNRLVERFIGAAIEVHRELGPGYLESVYEEALAVEMTLRRIPFERQYPIMLLYKGEMVGESRLDFLIDGRLVIELKSVESVLPVHLAQLMSYLKATNCFLGLLVNFNVPLLKDGIKRIVKS